MNYQKKQERNWTLLLTKVRIKGINVNMKIE